MQQGGAPGLGEVLMIGKMSSGLVDDCFKSCVTSFREDRLTPSETTCLSNCGKKGVAGFENLGQAMQSKAGQGGMGGF